MHTVVGVRFKKAGKIYYFDPKDLDIKKADYAIVETARGIEFGQILVGKKQISEEDIVSPLKDVIRIATEEDIAKNIINKEKASEAYDVCLEKINKHKLDMKLIDVEYTFDNNKVIFYFTADGRVDFRDLVKDLAAVFRTRIELRQIGVRDEAKMVGGYGSCGRPLCCSTFLGDFAPVSIKMAKEQGLSLNPTKISGVCGRLMCCLNYEEEGYKECLKCMPKQGEIIKTKFGTGIVLDVNILGKRVKARIRNEENVDQVMQVELVDIEERNCCKKKTEQIEKGIEGSKLVATEKFSEAELAKLVDDDKSAKKDKRKPKNNSYNKDKKNSRTNSANKENKFPRKNDIKKKIVTKYKPTSDKVVEKKENKNTENKNIKSKSDENKKTEKKNNENKIINENKINENKNTED